MNQNYYGFIIEKYGKWGITKKERMLILSQDSISYYPIPDDEEFHQNCIAFKNKLKENYDPKKIQELLQGANLTNDMKDKFPKSKQKAEILWKNFDNQIINVERMRFFEKGLDKDQLKKENKEWDIIITSNEQDFMRKIRTEFANTKSKIENDESKNQKKADENQNNKNVGQNNQFTHYKFLQSLEDIYQILWEEYYKEKFNSSKKPEPGKLAELELSIKIVLNEFTKYCERLTQVILSYLKPQSFTEKNMAKIIPILFVDLLKSEVQDHYLIYHFFGITITMTWNVVTYSLKDEQELDNAEKDKRGNSNINNLQINNERKESKGTNLNINNVGGSGQGAELRDDQINKIYGTWDLLKANFKQIDYYQNSAPDNITDKSKVLRVPLTCLIDYCGFRFLCECELPGRMKNNDSQKFEPKREIGEKCKAEYFQKCLTLFKELFFCNTSKKGGTFQKNDDNYGSQRSYMDNNKNGLGVEKTPYEKLFDIVNDYYSKQDNIGENIEQKSGQQSKSLLFQTLYNKALSDNNNSIASLSVEYFNINYNEFNNLIEDPRQISQDNIFFYKKTYFRPELISSNTGKDMNFGEQNFDYRNDRDNLENNKANDEQNQNKLVNLKDKNLNIFNNSLNSFYFKIYDSETMDNLFHSHGVNISSLGYIAEKSESPYVKEFAMNEMIARTCKKIIFNILATERMIPLLYFLNTKCSSIQNGPPSFNSSELPYKYQKLYNKQENKNDQKEDKTTTSWSYFKYLKEITISISSTAAQDDKDKFFINMWDLKFTGQQKNNDDATRNEILNITSAEDKKNQKIIGDNEGHNQNKKAKTIIADDHIAMFKELIALFLNVLFNKTNQKIKVKGKYLDHKELWKLIREEIDNYYQIESKEILIFCKLSCMSLPPFLSAFEYHTGIKLNWGKVTEVKNETDEKYEQEYFNPKNKDQDKKINFVGKNTTGNFTSKHILSIVWKKEDVLEITPKIKTFSYKFFVSNDKEKNEEYICNYSQLIINRNLSQVENFDKFMLLRFFYEKLSKTNNFSLWYIIFFNELKYDSFVEHMKESKDLKSEKEENLKDSESNIEEKSKKNAISNKNNECIQLYKFIFEELKKNEQSNKNTRYDLTGLLYNNEENNLDDEVNTNKNITYSLYMQKSFSRLGYIMINLAKEIHSIEKTEVNLPQGEGNMENNLENKKELNLNDSGDLNLKKGNQNSNKDLVEETKQFDGDEVFLHKEIILRFEVPFTYERQAIELIENFYIKDHPYFCDIKELCGKELLTQWKASYTNRRDLEKVIETYFKNAIDVGLKCLSINNIYLANIALDVGSFYAVREDYLNAVKIFNWAFLPFKNNSQHFQRDYYMYLKRFIKYNIKLGDFRTALALGDELLKENQNFRNEKDSKMTEYLNKNLHLERIVYNLALVALKVKDYEKGLRHCQMIFENKDQLSSANNNDFLISNNQKLRKTEYINWQKGKENDYPGCKLINKNIDPHDYEDSLKDEEYKLKLKLYMKTIIRSLVFDNKKQYLQAILRFYDSPEEKENLKEPKNMTKEERKIEKLKELREIKSLIPSNINLNEHFKSKILLSLKDKNRTEEAEKGPMKEKEQQNSDYELFKKLFKYFRDENVFYSFDKKDKNKKANEEFEEEEKKDDFDKKSIENNDKNINEEVEEEIEEDMKL